MCGNVVSGLGGETDRTRPKGPPSDPHPETVNLCSGLNECLSLSPHRDPYRNESPGTCSVLNAETALNS